jgi:tripartite-type tricarboxylate transporter receptor subunit TctC
MELLLRRAGATMLFVPYKGQVPVIQDTVAGRLDAMFFTASDQMVSLVKAGKLKILAAASEKRLRTFPDTPTFDEAGVPDLQVSGTIALFAPGGTPRDIVQRLNREVVRIMATPELQKLYDAQNLLPSSSTPEELLEQQRRDYRTWEPVIKSLGIKVE